MMLLWLSWYFFAYIKCEYQKFVNGTLLALKIPISLLEFFNKSLPLQMIEANNYKWLKLCFTDDRNLHVP